MNVHDTARRGFTKPDVYERGRPDYPAAAVTALGISPRMRVIDLGCGTGKLTRQLIETRASLVGVDPLPAMLETFRTLTPGVAAIRATAEAIPLRSGAADVVVCASAFHWFDHAQAIPEIHRVLRRGGRLAIVWNRRDTLTGWAKDFWEITETHRGATPGYRTAQWHDALDESPLFGEISEARFDHVQRTDLEGLLARVASISFIEVLPASERHRVLDGSRRFLETHPETKGRTSFELPYRTAVYVTESVD